MAGGKGQSRRGHEPRHIRLYHSVTGCAAWHDLSGNAIKVLVALLRFDRGGDNGELFMSVRVGADETGLSENTAWRALRELEDHGFIAATERGYFQQKNGPATQWRVTWQGAKGKAPTRDFERWKPETGNKTRSQKLSETVAKFAKVDETFPATVANSGTGATETSRVSRFGTVSKIATQVVCHRHGGNGRLKRSLKQPENIAGHFEASACDVTDAAIRDRISSLLEGAPSGTQTRLAAAAAEMPGGTLSRFARDGKALPEKYRAQLSLAVSAMEEAVGTMLMRGENN